MLSDVVLALKILSDIYGIYEQLNESQILFKRLCERVLLFEDFLQELKSSCSKPQFEPH